jgi:acetyl-CoA acyltransferase 2
VSARPEIVIVGGARTPMAEWIGGKRGDGKPGGALASVSAIDLGAVAVKGALERAKVAPDQVEHVIMGNAMQTSGDALYGARHVALKAGLPITTPALTVNRLCGSGIQSIVEAAHLLLLDEAKLVVAGGMENMSQAPHVLRGLRTGLRLGQQPPLEDSLAVALTDSACGCMMAQTSDNLAKRYGITREAQDDYAMRSHVAGTERTNSGRFAEEIVPVAIPTRKGDPIVVDRDDHFQVTPSREALAKLPAHFGPESTVTAGNASGVVDGAAAVVVTTADEAKARGLASLGSVIAWASVGVEPREMGIGPAPAIHAALARAGGREGARARPREGQRQRRRDRARAPARRDRHAAGLHASSRAGEAEEVDRRCLRLHRRRAGHRDGRPRGLEASPRSSAPATSDGARRSRR